MYVCVFCTSSNLGAGWRGQWEGISIQPHQNLLLKLWLLPPGPFPEPLCIICFWRCGESSCTGLCPQAQPETDFRSREQLERAQPICPTSDLPQFLFWNWGYCWCSNNSEDKLYVWLVYWGFARAAYDIGNKFRLWLMEFGPVCELFRFFWKQHHTGGCWEGLVGAAKAFKNKLLMGLVGLAIFGAPVKTRPPGRNQYIYIYIYVELDR